MKEFTAEMVIVMMNFHGKDFASMPRDIRDNSLEMAREVVRLRDLLHCISEDLGTMPDDDAHKVIDNMREMLSRPMVLLDDLDTVIARAHGLPEETTVSKECLDWLVPKVGDPEMTVTVTSVVDKLVELSDVVREHNKANDLTNQSLTQNIGKQVNLLVKALELHSQHPTFPIHCLIDSEELVGDYQWTGHIMSSVELGWWYEEKEGEQIWTEWDDIIDRIQCEGDEKDDHIELTAEQAGEIAKQRAHQVILIRTTAD